MGSDRIKKVNDLIRDEVGKIIQQDFEFDQALVTVTMADTSRTLEHSTVYLSVLPDDRASMVIKKLIKNVYPLQQTLNKKIIMRPVPKIRFELDQGGKIAQRLDELIGEIEPMEE